MNIALVGGFWAPNIGNAFIHLGAKHILQTVFGDNVNIFMVYDRPKYNNFMHTKKYIPKTSFEYVKDLDIDYFVISGPASIKYFIETWGDTIINLTNRKKKWMFIGAGMMRTDEESIKKVKEFFKKYPPYLMTSRDKEVFNTFKDVVDNLYDGIDLVFFLPDAVKPVKIENKKIIVSCFDKVTEPEITEWTSESKGRKIEIEGGRYLDLNFKSIFTSIGLKTDRVTDALIYGLAALPKGTRNGSVFGYDIVRTDHRISPLIMRKAYRFENSLCSDIPDPYATLYSNSEITVSDRIHACVATLAYGNKAMLFANTKRSALLDRMGLQNIYSEPVSIPKEYLYEEKNNLITYIRSKVSV